MDFRIEGGQQLARVSKQLKDAADKELQKSMRMALREAVKPVVADVKRQAAPVSQSVARTISARFSYSPRSAGATIRSDGRKMPAGKENLPRLLEFGSKGSGGRFIRHPVFGRDTWVTQPIRPYFHPTIQRHRAELDRAMQTVLEDVERQILKGTR